MSRIDRRLIELASPSGYLTRQRAYDAGISARQLRRRAQVGWIDQVGANGFVLVSDRRTKTVDLEASIAEIGGECWASGATAAALHGFDGYELRRPFHVTVMRGRNIERAGVRVHTTKEMPRIDRSVTNGIVLTSPARTVIELARSLDARRLTAALDSDCVTAGSTRICSTAASSRCTRRAATGSRCCSTSSPVSTPPAAVRAGSNGNTCGSPPPPDSRGRRHSWC